MSNVNERDAIVGEAQERGDLGVLSMLNISKRRERYWVG